MFYQESKTAKAAAIGTIMPWGGGITSIPKGWVICDGQFVDASAYPLLTQTIGDTYNTGTSSLAGNFPSYTGTILLPNLNDKALMDLETDYFGTGGSSTGRDADKDTDALTLLSNKIGTHQSQSIVTSFTNVYTDIVFSLPSTDLTDYQGKIKGNTKTDGEGTKVVYIAPRKLGRKHIVSHTHPGNYETMSVSNEMRPGRGVIPFGDVEYTVRFQATDNETGSTKGDTFYWGWTDDADAWHDGGDKWWETANNFVAPGISVGDHQNQQVSDPVTGWYPSGTQNEPYVAGDGSYGSDNHLYQLWWPDDTMTDTPIGINDGATGVVLAKVEATPPPYDMKPIGVTNTPITDKFIVTPDHPNGPRIDSSTEYKYGLGGGPVNVPDGYRNYYLASDATTLPYHPETLAVTPDGSPNWTGEELRQTLMSNPGYNFKEMSKPGEDEIFAHDHEEFEVEFDSTRLRVPSSLIANVNIPVQADFLGNAENKNALQIDFNIAQPQMTCVYIIRAY